MSTADIRFSINVDADKWREGVDAALLKWYDTLDELIDLGVLGPEGVPDPEFHRWPVLQPDKLPEFFKGDYEEFGEIRKY